MTNKKVNQFLYWLIDIRPLNYGNKHQRKIIKNTIKNEKTDRPSIKYNNDSYTGTKENL